jgi:hypothetical protein
MTTVHPLGVHPLRRALLSHRPEGGETRTSSELPHRAVPGAVVAKAAASEKQESVRGMTREREEGVFGTAARPPSAAQVGFSPLAHRWALGNNPASSRSDSSFARYRNQMRTGIASMYMLQTQSSLYSLPMQQNMYMLPTPVAHRGPHSSRLQIFTNVFGGTGANAFGGYNGNAFGGFSGNMSGGGAAFGF